MSTKVYFFIFSLTIINVISANPVMSDAADLNIDFDEIAPDFKIQETFDDANCEIDNSAVHISDEILENDQSEDLVRRQTKACPASRIKLPWTKFKTPWRAPSKMPQPEVDPSDRQIVLGSAHRLCIDELMPQLVSCSGPTIDHMSVTTSGYVLNCLPGIQPLIPARKPFPQITEDKIAYYCCHKRYDDAEHLYAGVLCARLVTINHYKPKSWNYVNLDMWLDNGAPAADLEP